MADSESVGGTNKTKLRRQRRKGKRAAAKARKAAAEEGAAPLTAAASGGKVSKAGTPSEKIKHWIAGQGGDSEEDIADEVCEYIFNIVSDTTVELEDVKELLVGLGVAPSFSRLDDAEQDKEVVKLANDLRGVDKSKVEDAKLPKTRGYENVPQAGARSGSTSYLLSDVKQRREWRENREIEAVKEEDMKKKMSIEQRLKSATINAEEGTVNFEECNVQLQSSNVSKSGSGANFTDVCLRLDGLMMAYDSTNLLNEADVKILTNHRYGLIGRNGVGKSTMMYHIEKLARTKMSVLYVAQEAEGTDTSSLKSVLEADVGTTELLQREQELTNMENPDTDELNRIAAQLEERDAASAEARASSILNGLSFTAEMQAAPTKSLSGGWRMRLALARALFLKPDLLLLDEPTNHLDLHAVIWLETYLADWATTLILVSHDSSFLNHVCTDIVEFRNRQLQFYRGNWDAYRKSSADRYLAQSREYAKQQEDIEHKQRFVDKWINNKFGYNAGLVQSRLKELEKMRPGGELHVEKPLPPGSGIFFKFPQPEKLASPLIHMKNVSFGYSNSRKLFSDQSLKVERGARIGLVGPNGAGKSTLLKLCVGEQWGGLRPTDGAVVSKGKLRLAWFHQHFVEQVDLALCPLEEMRKLLGPKVSEQEMRRRLGAFGINADLQVRKISLLSGGQKARLALAKLAAKEPHVYILDEPTNHLDIESVEGLAKALVNFQGAVIFVSHDESFCRTVATELWHCDGEQKNIEQLFCGFDGYRESVQKSLEAN